MEKLTVNDSCIGCGSCIAIDSEHFDFNDDGQSTVIKNDKLDTDELKNAIASCPVNAIEIKCDCGDGDGCNCGDDCHCTDSCPCHK